MKNICFSLALMLLSYVPSFTQAPEKPDVAEIYAAIEKLNTLGSVLYVAAHPDDENTRLISYFSNAKHYDVCYLSLTRGDGGQNLVGPEIREQLGIIRTQELLAARSIDGGEQMFSRANDFGYSKHPDETLRIWESEEILSDVIWAIRKRRPDIIVNRFDHRSPGRTHGHHTSSAMLSFDAFDQSNDPAIFPDQLKYVEPWQAGRLFFNTSWWFYGSRENFEKADKSNMVSVDVGTYIPVLGMSNNEIASYARSMHKCQGFGSSTTRGEQPEYLELLKGEMPEMTDPLAGINTTWSRLEGGAPVGKMLDEIKMNFSFHNPAASVPALLEVYKAIDQLKDDGFWKARKLKDCKQLIYWAAGLYIEATSKNPYAVRGGKLTVTLEALNRSDIDIKLLNYKLSNESVDSAIDYTLENNKKLEKEIKTNIAANAALSNPYWLNEEGSLGMYKVDDRQKIGKPESDPTMTLSYTLEINGVEIPMQTAVVYQTSDPVRGEIYKPFNIFPDLSISTDQEVYIMPAGVEQNIEISLTSFKNGLKGQLKVHTPEHWNAVPSTFEVEAKKGKKINFLTKLNSPAEGGSATLTYEFTHEDGTKEVAYESIDIDYEYIPEQHLIRPAKSEVVSIDVKTAGEKIGYIMGAGDEIPACLRAVGYTVDLLEEKDMRQDILSQYDAVVSGVRAYNTVNRMGYYQDELMKYVENGGTYIAQYNTYRRLKAEKLGPWDFNISRNRVTVEEAEVRMVDPAHALFNIPNKITEKDFDHWVQERGLYFADEWDDKYVTLLSSNDPGQEPTEGGLLLAEYGKGIFVYTGYSWFRQLPAAVPGAYRIFCNLLALQQNKTNERGSN